MKKAQLWSLDFAIAIVIFITALTLMLFFFNYSTSQSVEQNEFIEMQKTALTVSDSLVRTPGHPSNWTASSVTIIGLAIEDNVLDENKILEFVNMGYETARSMLVGKYQFFFEMRALNNNIVNINGTNITIGNIPSNSTAVIPIQRYAILKGNITKVNFIVWV